MMRARVLCPARVVTRYSSSLCWLMLPANTRSPGCLSTGRLSPVIGDWSTADWPASTSPSSPMRSPGRTRTRLSSGRSEEHTSELQSRPHLVCRLLLEKKKKKPQYMQNIKEHEQHER